MEGSPYLELIELSDYESYLIGLWHEAGTVGQGGMGLTALSWVEIVAWSNRMYSDEVVEWVQSPSRRWMPVLVKRCTLTEYELQIIRQLSIEYCSEAGENNPLRPCPREIIVEDISTEDAYDESMRMKDALLEMFGQKE